jgi:fluoride ion exporter CrcB/FEX
MTLSICAIASGAALGALLRWYFATRLNVLFPRLPPGTLTANIFGAYLIGIAMAVFVAHPGVTGGFVAQQKCQKILFFHDLRCSGYASSNQGVGGSNPSGRT